MQAKRGTLARWLTGLLVLSTAVLGTVGCVGDDLDPAPTGSQPTPDTEADPVPDPTARFDFSCVGQALPGKASDPVMISALTNDSYTGGLLPGVAVELRAVDGDHILAAAASDATGVATLAVATGYHPVPTYGRMIHAGHVDSYLYPSGPLWRDERNMFLPVLSPAWRDELAGYAGVDLDPGRGIVEVIVTDCAGERVEGATVAFDPPADAVAYWDPTFTDASATQTTINGHAWGFNVPAGEVHATITIGDVTYRDWAVRSYADSRTLSWRAP